MIPETVFGLPSHPLIVHAVVVLGPLSALGFVAVVVVPRWRRPYSPLVALGSLVAVVSAFAAVQAGKNLASSLGASGEFAEKIDRHSSLGGVVPWLLLAQTVLAVAFVIVERRDVARGVVVTVAVLGVVAAAASTVQIARAGDAGSRLIYGSSD